MALDCPSTYLSSSERQAGFIVTGMSPASAYAQRFAATNSPVSVHLLWALVSATPAIMPGRTGIVLAAARSNPSIVRSAIRGSVGRLARDIEKGIVVPRQLRTVLVQKRTDLQYGKHIGGAHVYADAMLSWSYQNRHAAVSNALESTITNGTTGTTGR